MQGRGEIPTPKNMKWTHNDRSLRERRTELRKNSTLEEEKLWFQLRNSNLGVKFKRQNSIGGYIVDFCCQKHKLIVEVDGEIHNTKKAKEYDAVRDKFFTDLGYVVLRFSNNEVNADIEKVVKIIRSCVE